MAPPPEASEERLLLDHRGAATAPPETALIDLREPLPPIRPFAAPVGPSLQTVFDAAPNAIIAINSDRAVIAWNRAATRLLGWTR